MNYSVSRFTLNLHTHRSQVSVPVVFGDTAARLLINLTDGGNAYTIEDGCIAVFRGLKADGTHLYNACIIENNTTIRYDFTEQTTSCQGIVECQIDLFGTDGKLLGSPKFILVVDNKVIDDESIVSEDEANVLAQMLTSETARVEAEEKRIEAETARADAEAERATSEETRISAEEARVEAENERAQAYGNLEQALDTIIEIQGNLIGGEAS